MTDVQTRNQLFWPSPASIYLLQYINRTNFAFPAANHNKTRSTTMTHKILSSFLHPVNHLCLENLHGWHFPVATCRNVWRRNGGAHFRTSWKALKRVKEKSKSTVTFTGEDEAEASGAQSPSQTLLLGHKSSRWWEWDHPLLEAYSKIVPFLRGSMSKPLFNRLEAVTHILCTHTRSYRNTTLCTNKQDCLTVQVCRYSPTDYPEKSSITDEFFLGRAHGLSHGWLILFYII